MVQRAICPVIVGREREIGVLEDALLEANRGQSRVIALGGEAGMGKTRIAAELKHRAEKIGAAVLWGSCSQAELALPYLPMLEALGNYLSTANKDEVIAELGHVAAELAQLFPQLSQVAPVQQDQTQAKQRLFEAIVALVSVASRDGLLLVVDDVHWADASTRELLDYMARRLREQRIAVLVTYRSDEMHRTHPLRPTLQAWERSGLAETLELQPLSREETAAMIERILDEKQVPVDMRDLMHQRSEGNPFVLEEMLKDALDRGDLSRKATGWFWRDVANVRVPGTVSETILHRLDRADTSTVEVLRAASILGRSFAHEPLLGVSGIDESDIQTAMDFALRSQLVEEDSSSSGTYRFRHALTQEAIYEDIVMPRRQQLHSKAADHLRSMSSARPTDLASHLLGAGRFDEAVPACIDGAQQAEITHAYTEAIALYQRALPHIRDSKMRADVLNSIGRDLLAEGKVARAESFMIEAVSTYEALGDDVGRAKALLLLGRCRWEMSRSEEAAIDYEKARQLLEPYGPTDELALAYIRISGIHLFRIEPEKAIDAARRGVTIADEIGADLISCWGPHWIGLGLSYLGEVANGLALLNESYQRCLDAGYFWYASNIAFNETWTRAHMMQKGAYEAARKQERLVSHISAASPPFHLASAYSHRISGRLVEMLSEAQETVELYTKDGSTKMAWRSRLMVSEALLEQGRIDEATRLLPDQSERTETQDLIYDTPAQVRVRLATGDLDGAVRQASEVLKVAPKLNCYRITLAAAAEAFLAAGMLPEIESLLRMGRAAPTTAGDAYLDLIEGRLMLASSAEVEAVQLIERATSGFAAAGFIVEEMRANIWLAEARAKTGDDKAAVRGLQAVIDEASHLGAELIRAEAIRIARDLGLQITETAVEPNMSTEPPEIIDLGEKMVTVMFADVRGYTAMTEQTSPEEITDRIGSLHRWSKREIEKHLGLVDMFAGDAVMATFNVSGATVDHCDHALQAALMLKDKAAMMDMQVGIGIAVGPAVVGRLTEGGNVTALGTTTNLASRLQSTAAGGEILLSEEAHERVTYSLSRHGVKAERAEAELKGLGVTAFYRVR